MWNPDDLVDWDKHPDGVIALIAAVALAAFTVTYIITSTVIVPKQMHPSRRSLASQDNEYARSAAPVLVNVTSRKAEDNPDDQTPTKIMYDEDPDPLIIEYVPLLAWNRAINFFCITILFAYPTGLLRDILKNPIITKDQTSSSGWIFMTAFCSLFMFIFYWIVWPRWTLTFERRFHIIPCVSFALLEGIGNALIIVNVYYICEFLIKFPNWGTYIVTWSLVGFWQGTFGTYYWNLYVLPEHDTPDSLKMKTAVCHIPNLTITLTYLLKWNNLLLFICFQTFALLGCTMFMRFPSPFTTQRIHVATWTRGACGFPKAIGYKDPLSKREEESRRFFDREEEEDTE
jgi:hypothetical protein